MGSWPQRLQFRNKRYADDVVVSPAVSGYTNLQTVLSTMAEAIGGEPGSEITRYADEVLFRPGSEIGDDASVQESLERFDTYIGADRLASEVLIDAAEDPDDLLTGYSHAQAALLAYETVRRNLLVPVSRIITPEQHGADPEGADDSFAAVKAAIEEAASDPGYVLEARGVYRLLPSSVISVGTGLRVRGGGKFYVASEPASNMLLEVAIPPLVDVGVVALTTSVYDFAGVNSSDTDCTRVELSAPNAALVATALAAGNGDCKIISADACPGGATGAYSGEAAYILAVSSPYVYLTGKLRGSYSTSVRLIVLDSQQRVSLDDLRIDSDFALATSEAWDASYVRVEGAVDPSFGRLRMQHGTSAGLWLRGCIRAASTDLSMRRFRSAVVTLSITGYGIRETGCTLSSHIAPRVADVRHGYTTTTTDGAVAEGVVAGRTYGSTVIGGQGSGGSAAPWDTHSDAEQVTFYACKSYHTYDGEGSGWEGVQLRGEARAVACEVIGGSCGYRLKRELASEVGVRRLVDCEYRGELRAWEVAAVPTLTGDDALVEYEITGGRFDTSSPIGSAIYCRSKGYMWGARYRLTSDEQFFKAIRLTDSGGQESEEIVLTARDCEWDIRASTGGDFRVADYNTVGSVVDIEGRVINDAVPWKAWLATHTLSTEVITANGIIDADTMPTNTDGVSALPASGNTISAVITAKRGRVGSNGMRPITSAGASPITVGPGDCCAPIVHQMVTANAVAAEITAFTAGKIEGQLLVITVGPASTQDLTITPLEAGLIRMPAAISIAIKGAATFMWTFDADGDGTADAGIWVRCG